MITVSLLTDQLKITWKEAHALILLLLCGINLYNIYFPFAFYRGAGAWRRTPTTCSSGPRAAVPPLCEYSSRRRYGTVRPLELFHPRLQMRRQHRPKPQPLQPSPFVCGDSSSNEEQSILQPHNVKSPKPRAASKLTPLCQNGKSPAKKTRRPAQTVIKKKWH